MPNQSSNKESMVENGTAPLECLPQMKKFRKNPVPKTMAG